MSGGNAPGAMPDLSALIGTLLSNPAAMSMLTSLLANKTGSVSVGDAPPPQAERVQSDPAPTSTPPQFAPAQAALAPTHGQDDRTALLCALRPFLPPEKCDMIDGLLRILDLLTIIRRRR